MLAALINFHTAIWMQKRSRIFFIPAEAVVVLAHSGRYKADNVMEMMIEKHMLDGIELNHPRNDEKTREHITSLCKEHDLFMTGGTDFHGLYTKTPYPLGSFLCPKEGLHRLILAGEQANKAFYEKHPKFKK